MKGSVLRTPTGSEWHRWLWCCLRVVPKNTFFEGRRCLAECREGWKVAGGGPEYSGILEKRLRAAVSPVCATACNLSLCLAWKMNRHRRDDRISRCRRPSARRNNACEKILRTPNGMPAVCLCRRKKLRRGMETDNTETTVTRHGGELQQTSQSKEI